MARNNWTKTDNGYYIQFDEYFCASIEWQQCQFYYVLYQCGFVLIEGYSDTPQQAKQKITVKWISKREIKYTGVCVRR